MLSGLLFARQEAKMFTKEAQSLAKESIEAIKFLSEKAGKKCPECKGSGKVVAAHSGSYNISFSAKLVPCEACNGSGKAKWKWNPKAGEWCANKEGGYPQLISGVDKKTGDLYLSSTSGHIWLNSANFIPLLHWEREIEKTLEEMGYAFEEPIRRCYGSEGFRCHCVISLNGRRVGWGWSKDRQTSAMLATINARKEMQNEKPLQQKG